MYKNWGTDVRGDATSQWVVEEGMGERREYGERSIAQQSRMHHNTIIMTSQPSPTPDTRRHHLPILLLLLLTPTPSGDSPSDIVVDY